MSIDRGIQQEVLNLIENCEIRKLCDNFFSEKFLWVVKGSGVLSKTYTDKEVYFSQAFDRLGKVLLPGWKMNIVNSYIINDTLIVELCGEGKAKSGNQYNNEYCWIIKFNHDKIVSITAYLDTLLLEKILMENEA